MGRNPGGGSAGWFAGNSRECADVLEQIEQARAAVRVPTLPEVITAQAAAVAAAKALDIYLKQLPTGQIVSKEIKLNELSAELLQVPVDAAALAKFDEGLKYSHHSSVAQIGLQLAVRELSGSSTCSGEA